MEKKHLNVITVNCGLIKKNYSILLNLGLRYDQKIVRHFFE